MAANIAFDSSEFQKWIKQWKAVFITRIALLPSVTLEAKHLHKYFLQKASNEQTCSSDHGHISDRIPILCRYNEKLRNEINAIHKRKKPSWRNASTDTWRDSPFAVAKLFMQPSGYVDTFSFDGIDFNGLRAFIYNCGRFTLIVENLSDEARKYVNKIRHMPAVCLSALTDQATVECIDSMDAVLNDPSFDGDPEVLEARKQLDELKTVIAEPNADILKYIIEDIAIRGVQEITELASAEEDEWSENRSEIKGAIEKLGGILMSSLEEQGGSAIYDIKATFENALAQLDSSIDNPKKIIIETTEEGIPKLTATGQSERLEIEEATLRGYRELEETRTTGS
ncbi:uncharacterized protein LOC128219555 [Mya arenaria]|uniref:uncharacterized protein LOC128219555 n=1 Tax=Mya arenaria TaxID=6604 RepID=UPI0022E8C016|nr:uncharacterized protein LOC128219555 [Mya arenaria]XP_052783456.1 uncharacterized protein LOC128219555 [Mya arenaria]XP_052783527.1 uncharacterized protein LOC128219555 [Mya arenaria]XP_052783606.1 uncharacterized protein LOC128219555 [Mya arenaria]XP_052783685.1 uncharacterized protein LOC128219555 [Mya arenaria]XP_052783773.1 uncharacterized protein LOC128219555 [Mya arenaria]XP_052783862.1 uncharacterized protein LOC128219555 [Mya arenaria]XP_052783953.1 uncharacterized protein LOC1282